MNRRTIRDPDCCMWQVQLNGWPLLWGRTVVEADPDEDQVTVVYRDDDDTLIPVAQLPFAEGTEWIDGSLVAAEFHRGSVVFIPFDELDRDTQRRHAYSQGCIDRVMGRSHWGRVHFPMQYALLTEYDHGYRTGQFVV